jgi:hypothetical protein
LLERLVRCFISCHSSKTSIKITKLAATGPKSISLEFGLADSDREIELFIDANSGNISNSDERIRMTKDVFLYFEGITELKRIGETKSNGIGR